MFCSFCLITSSKMAIRVYFCHLASTSRPRLWSGIMHFLQHSQAHTAREFIHYFFANEIRRDDVYLNYVHRLATRHHVPAVITFDQPLFWKASEIVQGLPMGHPMGHNNIWLNHQYMSEVARTLIQSMVELPILRWH